MDMKVLKKIFIGIGIVVGIILAILIAFIIFATQSGKGMAEAIENHLTALRAGNIEQAYAYTSDDFQTQTSLEDFKKLVESHPSLENNGEIAFEGSMTSKDFASGIKTGSIKSMLRSQDKKATNAVNYTLRMADDGWKISSMEIHPLFYDEYLGYSIQYPEGWIYEKVGEFEVNFKKGSLPIRVNIVNVASVQQGGKHENVEQIVHALKEEIKTATLHASILDENEFFYEQGTSRELSGKQFKAEYIFQGEKFKQWKIILQRKNGGIFYVWTYTARADVFNKYSPEANLMLSLWRLL